MFAYNLRLAWLSLRRTPVLTALMIGAIALGIGVSMTTVTVYYLMSGNPIPHKSDDLFAVRIDSWSPEHGWDDDSGEPPWEFTYKDAVALLESPVPTRQAAMFKGVFTLDPERQDLNPFLVVSRNTGGDFFAMFDLPFLYGGGWPASADETAAQVIVLSRETNEKLFGGENSVGRQVKLGQRYFTVTGVLDTWSPIPKFYDVNNGPFNDSEDLYMPFSLIGKYEFDREGNTNCWKPQQITSHAEFLESECVWIQFWAELPDRDARERYTAWLDAYVAEQKKLGRLERPLNNRIDNVEDWLDVRGVVRNDNRVLVGLAFLFLAVCLFNTIGLLLARFLHKAPVIGLRRALGASRGAIFRQHLIEVAIIGLAGGVVGLALCLLGLEAVKALYSGFERLAYLDAVLVAMALAIAVASGIVAGLYPTWQICRINPAHHLKTQ